jgi:serine/threonine-protein kinase
MRECPECLRCYADDVSTCPVDDARLLFGFAGEPLLKDRYLLERRIGVGGMGKVYKARHLFLKTDHAIKVILPQNVGDDPELVQRFRQEAVATAAIRHPNIVAVTDFDVIRGETPFLVMEYVNGRSLDTLISEEGALPLPQLLEIMEALCAGVGAAHRLGIIHRDLKPLNILLQDGVPHQQGLKILDFGLAKMRREDMFGSLILAKTKGFIGSPYYMAPEQWSEEQPDMRTDVYALGIILYQMLTGNVPFKGPSLMSVMKQHLFSTPPPLAPDHRQIPAGIQQVVNRVLAKERDQRPASANGLWEALNAAARPALEATQYNPPGRRTAVPPPEEPPAPTEREAQTTDMTNLDELLASLDPASGETLVDVAPASLAPEPEPPAKDLEETLVRPEGVKPAPPPPPAVSHESIPRFTLPGAESSDPNMLGRHTTAIDESRLVIPMPPAPPRANPKVVWIGAALIALLCLGVAGTGLWRWQTSRGEESSGSNKHATAVAGETIGGRGRSLALDYYVQVENGARIADTQALRAGDRIRLHFVAREAGYMYILNHQGRTLQLFLSQNPAPGVGLSTNQLEAGVDFSFPGGDKWLQVAPGEKEIVYTVLLSPRPLTEHNFLAAPDIKDLSASEKGVIMALQQQAIARGDMADIGPAATNERARTVSLPAKTDTAAKERGRLVIFDVTLRVQ